MEIILSTPILVCLVFLVNNISRNKNSFHDISCFILMQRSALFQELLSINWYFRNENTQVSLNNATAIYLIWKRNEMEITKDFRGEVLEGISGQKSFGKYFWRFATSRSSTDASLAPPHLGCQCSWNRQIHRSWNKLCLLHCFFVILLQIAVKPH